MFCEIGQALHRWGLSRNFLLEQVVLPLPHVGFLASAFESFEMEYRPDLIWMFHHCYAYIPVKKTACYCMQTNKTTTLRGNVCFFKVYFYFAVSIKVLLSWNPIRELISL